MAVVVSPLGCAGPRDEAAAAPQPRAAERELKTLEARLGGRLGLHAVNLATGDRLSYRADERFAMCSTFKWALAAAVLQRVDRGEVALSQQVPFTEADLLEYAPVTKQHVEAGHLTVEQLGEAAVTLSDNTAANLLLDLVGGPAGLTEFLRDSGDATTRLDRNEPTLNLNEPGDSRDTTTPRAMATTLQTLLEPGALSSESRKLLRQWLLGCKTCDQRFRAGLPAGWRAGNKTGTGLRGLVGDVGMLEPAKAGPIYFAAYLSDSEQELPKLLEGMAELGRITARTLGA